MAEQASYPLELLRAELKSAMAEQLVNLMDRFVSKTDFLQHTKEDEQHFKEINTKLDTLLREKDNRDGASTERETRSARWYVMLALAATLVTAVVGALGSVVASAFFGA